MPLNMITTSHIHIEINYTSHPNNLTRDTSILYYNTNNQISHPFHNIHTYLPTNQPHQHHYHSLHSLFKIPPYLLTNNNGKPKHDHISNIHTIHHVHIHPTPILIFPIITLIHIRTVYYATHITPHIHTQPTPNLLMSPHISNTSIEFPINKSDSASRPRHIINIIYYQTTHESHLYHIIKLHPPTNRLCTITCSHSYTPLDSYTKCPQYSYITIQLSPHQIGNIMLPPWTYLINSRSHTTLKLPPTPTHSHYPHSPYLPNLILLHPSLLPAHNHPSHMYSLLLTCLINNCINVLPITYFTLFQLSFLAPITIFPWAITTFPLSTFYLLAHNNLLITHTTLFGTLNSNKYTQTIFTLRHKTQHILYHTLHYPTYIYQTPTNTHHISPKIYMPKYLQCTIHPPSLLIITLATPFYYSTSPTNHPPLLTLHLHPLEFPQRPLLTTHQNHKSTITSRYHTTHVHIPLHTTPHVHNHLILTKPIPHIPPIPSVTFISHILYITHTHLAHPKKHHLIYYMWNHSKIILLSGDIQPNPGPSPFMLNFLPTDTTHTPKFNFTSHPLFPPHLCLLQCGDIHPNPGPMPDILHTHPTAHKRRQLTYFIPTTIKFQPEYQHLAHAFAPIFKPLHPLHAQTIISFPHLYRYTQLLTHHPPPRIIYALIVSISPSIDICNLTLQQAPTPDWTLQLLEVMSTLPNPPERHIETIHPYTQF